MCLQEIKAASDQVPGALFELEGYWCHWHGGGGYSGVALHIRKELSPDRPRFSIPPFDFDHRIVSAPVANLIVSSVYVPNGNRDFPAKMRFLEALGSYIRDAHRTGQTIVVCGDLNVARHERDVHPKERKPRAIGQLPEERALLERILDGGVVDVGRALDPDNDSVFTWWPPWRQMRERNIGWRLDYVLASSALATRAVLCPVQRDVGTSDHAPVVATFADERIAP